jgi:hypothetical protein
MMRLGYSARGVVYVLVGALAFLAAESGASAPDSKTALGALLQMPLGEMALGAIGAGLLAYAFWCFIDGVLDLDDKGGDMKGCAARGAKIISGALHLMLAFSVAQLVLGGSSDKGGDSAEHWTAILLQHPFGRSIVAVVGLVALAFGVQHFVKAHKEKYKDTMRYTSLAERLAPVLKIGLAAHGVVALLVGAFFLWAAWTAEPSRAGGLRDALEVVRAADAGRILLAVVALGLIGFAVYCFIEAAFRIVPRCAPPDLETLASRARALVSDPVEALSRARR